MGKFGKISILLVIILLATNVYTAFSLYIANIRINRLIGELQTVELDRAKLYDKLKEMEMKIEALNSSYHKVLEANKKLEEALKYLEGKLIVPYNFTLIPPKEFQEKYHFAYTEDMVEFVMNVTNGWDGSEKDFLEDLYKIYKAWRNIFVYDEKAFIPGIKLPLIHIVGGWNIHTTEMGDRYVDLAFYAEDPIIYVWFYPAAIDFKTRRGTCGQYATVLVTLYYAYSDIVGRKLPVAYLSIGIGDEHHACVLLKGDDELIAIIDWEPITVEDGKIKFMPLDEAKKLHSRYWWGYELSYDGILMRPSISKKFNSLEEFRKWLKEEFN